MKFGENLPGSFFEILKFPRSTRDISKFQKSELGKFIPNFPLKHVITSTNSIKVEASDGVLLLGITVDNKLTFKTTY